MAEAIIINPNNRLEVAAALREALGIPIQEQQRRNRLMQRRLQRYNVTRWASDFLAALAKMRDVQSGLESKLLFGAAREKVIERYRKSRRRLLLLDYDGTLTPLMAHPMIAAPNDTLIQLLNKLAAQPTNDVVLTSGRDRFTLESWFGALPLGLVAEHGAWYRFSGQSWQRAHAPASDWKKDLLPVLDTYADRLPGSFVEEKEESVAWHYRLADPEQSAVYASELVDHLLNLTAKTDLQVVQGARVIELRRSGIDKGSAAERWLARAPADFTCAIGDDTGDEDLFKALPPDAVTIRVGLSTTYAQHNLRNCVEVIALLHSFVD
jgi:trehalose 6-phosphate synthase/phosphatase